MSLLRNVPLSLGVAPLLELSALPRGTREPPRGASPSRWPCHGDREDFAGPRVSRAGPARCFGRRFVQRDSDSRLSAESTSWRENPPACDLDGFVPSTVAAEWPSSLGRGRGGGQRATAGAGRTSLGAFETSPLRSMADATSSTHVTCHGRSAFAERPPFPCDLQPSAPCTCQPFRPRPGFPACLLRICPARSARPPPTPERSGSFSLFLWSRTLGDRKRDASGTSGGCSRGRCTSTAPSASL